VGSTIEKPKIKGADKLLRNQEIRDLRDWMAARLNNR
jgi:hypothetical protein